MMFVFLLITFGIGATVAVEECPKNITEQQVKECRHCSGSLLVNVQSKKKWFIVDDVNGINDDIEINCTSNKQSNLSIHFQQNQLYRPRDEKHSRELTRSNGCRIRFKLKKEDLSLCHDGKYVCRGQDNDGSIIKKSIDVNGAPSKADKFSFKVQGRTHDGNVNTNELIIGTSANLSCAYRDKTSLWDIPFTEPYLSFRQFDAHGNVSTIQESLTKAPKRYEWSKTEKSCEEDFCTGTRKLLIRRINESDSRVYLCRVTISAVAGCQVEKNLTLRARPCKAGHYCNVNTGLETACPAGTYSNKTGLFSSSGCRECPIDSYCPRGSTLPIKCPRWPFLSSQKSSSFMKILKGKRAETDCRTCPVTPCDKIGAKCSLICSQHSSVQAQLGSSVTITCTLSNRNLVKGLTWTRGNKTFVNDSSYSVIQSGAMFSLIISRMEETDTGFYTCQGTEIVMGNTVKSSTKLVITTKSDPQDQQEFFGADKTVIISILLPFVLIAIFASLLFYRWRRNKCNDQVYVTDLLTDTYLPDKNHLFTRVPSNNSEVEHEFDVFICYSSADKVWVRKTLLTTLKEHNLRVCIDFQDFAIGEFIIANIADAIYKSRKTIAVLSPDFVDSDWCQKELQMALTRIENQHQVIPILYRECSVPRFLRHRTYLDWCNPDVRVTFWEQLLTKIAEGKGVVTNAESSQ